MARRIRVRVPGWEDAHHGGGTHRAAATAVTSAPRCRPTVATDRRLAGAAPFTSLHRGDGAEAAEAYGGASEVEAAPPLSGAAAAEGAGTARPSHRAIWRWRWLPCPRERWRLRGQASYAAALEIPGQREMGDGSWRSGALSVPTARICRCSPSTPAPRGAEDAARPPPCSHHRLRLSSDALPEPPL
uniref:Uncharacterized protein n=1 Tax=Oryza glaberrima TaxID=4538 RepID=I1NRD8_ORYGL